MTHKTDYYATAVSQFKQWDAEFQALKIKRDELTAAAHVQYDKQVTDMRVNRDAAFRKLQELGTASESAWRDMQVGVDAAWASLKSALDQASFEVKKTHGPGSLAVRAFTLGISNEFQGD